MSLREREYRVTQLLELSEDKKSVVGVIEKKPIVNSARVYLKEDVDKAVKELKERIEGDCFSSDSACVYPVLDLDKIMKAIKEVFE